MTLKRALCYIFLFGHWWDEEELVQTYGFLGQFVCVCMVCGTFKIEWRYLKERNNATN